MNRECVQAYLWDALIRLGFQPKSLKDQKSWLYQYGKSLKAFLEIDSYPQPPKVINDSIKGEIDDFGDINICIDYSIGIKNNPRDAVCFLYALNQFMWLHHVDRGYFDFPVEVFLSQHKKRKQAIREVQDEDIEVIIDGLICHPRIHKHLELPINNHEIRIGG